MRKYPISVFIVCQNEEQHIARCLESCSSFAEIIVVDSGSTDKSLDIIKNYPVKLLHKEWQGYAQQKQYALEQCSHDWVLNLDADEQLNDELIDKFVEIMQADKVDGVRCNRIDMFMGNKPAGFTKKANNLRFYRRAKIKFDASTLVHETAQLDGKEISISQAFTHYGYDNIKAVVDKNNQYSSLKALEKFQKNKKFSYLKLIFIFPLIFIKMYFLQGYIFSGMRGFIQANSVAYYAFIKEAKLYELHKNSNKS